MEKKEQQKIESTMTKLLGVKEEGIVGTQIMTPVTADSANSVTTTSSATAHYKEHLALLIARGKTKEFLGKNITFNELDMMSPKDLEKYYKLYEAAQAARINEAVSHGVINGYSYLCGYLVKTSDEKLKQLNDDLKNDFLVMNEIQKWTGYLSFQMGGLMSIVSAALITFKNISPINGSSDSVSARDSTSVSTSTSDNTSDSTSNVSTSDSTSNNENTSGNTSNKKAKVSKTNCLG